MDLSHLWLQLLARLSGSLVFLISGSLLSWTSSVQIKFQQDSSMNLTDSEVAGLVYWMCLGVMCAPHAMIKAANFFGRRNVLAATAVPFLICWIMMTLAESRIVLYTGRFIGGLGIGTAFTVGPMYIIEIAEVSSRKTPKSFFQVMMSVGILFEYAIGPYVSKDILSVVSAVLPLLLILTIVWMPESPYYHIMNKNEVDAVKSLLRLRRNALSEDITYEMDVIQRSVESNAPLRIRLKDLVAKRASTIALILVLALIFNQQLAGILPILSFMARIFQMSGSSLNINGCAIAVGAIHLVFSLISCQMVKHTGRRPMLIISALGCAVSLAVLGIYFLLETGSALDWVPLAAMALYVTTFVLGLGPLPWVVATEIFPTDIKYIAIATATVLNAAFGILAVLIFDYLTSSVGQYLPFFIFSGFTALGFIWIYIFLPETKGKYSLHVIVDFDKEPSRSSGNISRNISYES